MKNIDVKNLSKHQKFVTRYGFDVKFIQYVPEANKKSRLLFLLNGNIIGCDETGKCWSINSYDVSYTDTDYSKFDIFIDDSVFGFINLYKSGGKFISDGVYSSEEEAKENVSSKETFIKTIKIEWSEE